MQSIKRTFLVALLTAACVFFGESNSVAADEPVVSFDTSADGKMSIKIGDQQVALYVYQDDDISRPYFAHLRAPGAPQASRTYPPIEGKDRADHGTYHPGLWMSFGDISGNDYWRLAAPVKHVHCTQAPQGGPGKGTFTVHNRFLDQQDATKTVCNEQCKFTILVRPRGYLLLWDSTFSAESEFYFGDQEEMGIGFRVATPIRVETDSKGGIVPGNGTMMDSEGRKNGNEIWGNTADWCDYSGTLDGKHIGITLLCHPKNFRPSWFHARDYGLLEANPFGREAFGNGEKSKVVVKPGEEFRIRYGVLVHSSPADAAPDLAAAYKDYLSVSGE